MLNVGLKSAKRLLHDAPSQCPVGCGGQCWIPTHMLDFHTLNHAVRARLHREGRERRDHNDWDARAFDFFADRCAATITRSSGRNKQGTMDSLGP